MKYVNMFLKESRYSGVYASTFSNHFIIIQPAKCQRQSVDLFQCIRGLYHSCQIRHQRQWSRGFPVWEVLLVSRPLFGIVSFLVVYLQDVLNSLLTLAASDVSGKYQTLLVILLREWVPKQAAKRSVFNLRNVLAFKYWCNNLSRKQISDPN